MFKDGTDIWFARQLVTERLKLAEADIPPGYGRPELAPVSTGLGEIYEFYLASKTHTPMELRTLLDWVVALSSCARCPASSRSTRMGGEAKQYQVVLDPEAAGRLPPVAGRHPRAARAQQRAPSAAATSRRTRESFVIRGDAQFKSLDDIDEHRRHRPTPTARRCCSSTWATVQLGPALRFGVVTKHGEGEIVAGTVMMLIGANSREVVHGGQGASSPRSSSELPRGRRDPLVLRPRRVHRPHAARPSPSTWPRARCWSSSCCS